MPIFRSKCGFDQGMSSTHTAVKNTNCDILVRWRHPFEQFITPVTLLGAAKAHEEGWCILRAPQLGHNIAVSNKPIQPCYASEREHDFSLGKPDGMRSQRNIQRSSDALEILPAPFAQPNLPPDLFVWLLREKRIIVGV